MEKIILSTNEKLRLLKKTKEIYVKQYTACWLNNRMGISSEYVPSGLCACFLRACHDCGYWYCIPKDCNISNYNISKIFPEWDKDFAYKISPLVVTSDIEKWDIDFGFWYPVWDKANRINFLNWLINKYTILSTIINSSLYV